MKANQLALAETFHSIQGEGTWTGTPMYFIRLAGCTVGRLKDTALPSLPASADGRTFLTGGSPAWTCRTHDGRPFYCDTDFSVHEHATYEDLLGQCREDHICFTGGEPLAQLNRILPLIRMILDLDKWVHIETSGTIPWTDLQRYNHVWVTVSPKGGYLLGILASAQELKLLVDQDFPKHLPVEVLNHPNVWVQPINLDKEVNQDNLERAISLLRDHPNWRLSVQLHKFLGLR